MAESKSDKNFEQLDEKSGEEVVTAELNSAAELFKTSRVFSADEAKRQSWDVAAKVVKQFRPVPWLLWRIIYSVFGKPSQTGKPDSIVFDAVRPLMVKAAQDPSLTGDKPMGDANKRFDDAVKLIGSDVCASLSILHAVCRRIRHSLAERVWRPILDDALMRAQIGYHVGETSKAFGRGRGMLAGFSGRSGLAILIGSGDLNQAHRALEGLASGKDIRDVGLSVYGCDPLQVAAMTLSAAGCNFEAAFGTANYSLGGNDVKPGSEALLWLSAFAVAENLRMNTPENIEKRYWDALGLNPAQQGQLKEKVRTLQRRGPSWRWLIDAQRE